MNLNKLTKEETEEALEMYRSGSYTVADIADWFGVSFYIVRHKIEKYEERKAL